METPRNPPCFVPYIPLSPPYQGHNILHPLLVLHLELPCVQEWNQHGVARVCHMLTILQPALASLAGASSSNADRQFDKARLYFSLLMYSPEGLQRAVMDKPGRFTLSEYTALLQVRLACVATQNKAGPVYSSSDGCCSISQIYHGRFLALGHLLHVGITCVYFATIFLSVCYLT